ncbi:MFS transporter [Arthrobacter sp. B2a2-09]|nr:MFS transporter [Arthrobacter sp. B2a2-09]
MAYSLALRLEDLAPNRADVLGYILGIGSAASLVFAPVSGVLSDHTRSRWGRRRPYTVIGVFVGLSSVPVMAYAPSIPVLGLAWVLSTIGWGTAAGSIGNWQADQLPEHQRGRVSGLTGMTMQLAPVIGILLVGLMGKQILLVFLVPAAIGTVLIVLFVFGAPETDSRRFTHTESLSIGHVFRSYTFSPREFPDFAWAWAGRFIFFLGLTLTTSFTVYFFAQRLGLPVSGVASVIGLTSALSIISATLGSVGAGWLSDRMHRRRPYIVVAVIVFAGGAVISAFAHELTWLLVGSVVNSLGIAVFSSVGQALVLDVLPHRETQAGRYMAITAFSQKIPGVVAPILAPVILALGSSAGEQNFTALCLFSAMLAVAGGLTISVGVRHSP